MLVGFMNVNCLNLERWRRGLTIKIEYRGVVIVYREVNKNQANFVPIIFWILKKMLLFVQFRKEIQR